MAKRKLRGEEWEINREKGTLSITIKRAQKSSFSISDMAKDYVARGYKALVTVEGHLVEITQSTPVLFKETVPSKFAGMGPWYRYWYSFKIEDPKQERFF
jgi:hypothetical protein